MPKFVHMCKAFFLASVHRDFSLGLNESIIESMSPVIQPTTLVPSIKM